MKKLILPRDRYKSPPPKYRTSRHIKGSTRLAPMNQYGNDTLKNNGYYSTNHDLNSTSTKMQTPHENSHKSNFDSNLQKIEPLIIPSKEKRDGLTGKRLELHKIIVKNICACELEGIINYALECITKMQSINISPNELFQEEYDLLGAESIFNQNKLRFIKGEFTPESIDPISKLSNSEKQTILSTFHTIDSQNYLHFASEPIYKSLSNIFNVEISENHLSDPNPILNSIINEYQTQMIPFLSPYFPFKQISFPFIIGIGGPPSSGKTTVCQFLQKAFTINVIHINYNTPDQDKTEKKPPTSLKKSIDKPTKKITSDAPPNSMLITELLIQSNPADDNDENDDSNEEEELIETEKPPPYYPLPNAYEINYIDDKSTVNSIVSLIQNIITENNANTSNKNDVGFVIDGFPNNKNQHSLLEKALASKNINMHENQIKHMLAPPSQRARAQMTSIDYVIITTASSNNINDTGKSANSTMTSSFFSTRKRFIDPETGNIYSPGFHMPCLTDLIGISPPFFSEKKEGIEKRLEEVPLDESVTSKTIQKFIQFESTLKKGNKSLLISNCKDSTELLEQLDEFIERIYKNMQNLIPTINNSIGKSKKKENHQNYNQNSIKIRPMSTLMNPLSLIKPELTFTAMSTWSQCFEVFGKPISGQSQLVTSLSEKVETLQKVAIERFQLLISQRDERDKLCSKFIEEVKNKLNVNNCFNLNSVDQIKTETSTNLYTVSSPKLKNDATKTKANPRFKMVNSNRNLDEPQSKASDLMDLNEINDLLSNHFRQIWDSSISVRTKNLEFVDDVVNKCGLIELILEFRKSPKKFFVFLVNRMAHVKWFFDNFSHIQNFDVTENQQNRYPFFDDLNLRTIEIPKVNFMLSKPPADIKKFKSMFDIDKSEIHNNRKPPENDSPKISNMKSYMLSDQSINYPSKSEDDTSMTIKQPESARPNYKGTDDNDNRCMAKLKGFKLLEEEFNISKKPDDAIFFDNSAACDALGIMKFTPSNNCSFETETLQYAEEFFNHVFVSFDGNFEDDNSEHQNSIKIDAKSLMANEAKICLKIFRKFATACRRKEASMVASVFDLQDSLKQYTNSKTTREMEKFSKRFRALKIFINGAAQRISNHLMQSKASKSSDVEDGKTKKRLNYITPYDRMKQQTTTTTLTSKNEKNFDALFTSEEVNFLANLNVTDLFEYDVDLISEDVRFLADLSLHLTHPIVLQPLIPFDSIVDVAEEASIRGQLFTSIDDFMSNVRRARLTDFDMMKLELFVRVSECVESFDIKPFLLLFVRDENDEKELNEVFNRPPKPVNNMIASSLSSFVKGLTETAAILSSTINNNENDDNDMGEEEEEEEEARDCDDNIGDGENAGAKSEEE